MEHPIAVDYLRWIVLLPLLGAIVNGLGGALDPEGGCGKRAISVIACAPVILAFAARGARLRRSCSASSPSERLLLDHLFTWIDVGTLHVDVAFQLDPLSAVMILVVTGVGGLIHVYSIGYMHDDAGVLRATSPT